MTLTAMRETRPGFDGITGTGTLPTVEFSYEIFSRDNKRSGQLGVMMPPEPYSQLQEPEILEIIRSHSGPAATARDLVEHIDRCWLPNVTLTDVDLAIDRGGPEHAFLNKPDDIKIENMFTDPIHQAMYMPPEFRGSSVLETFAGFFQSTARTVATLSATGRLMIEAIAGKMTDTLERIRWGCFEGRAKIVGGVDPSQFASKYDSIHMDNIP